MPKRPITIIFAARAKQELDEARTWWEAHREAGALADALAAVLRRLEAFPEMAPPVSIKLPYSKTVIG